MKKNLFLLILLTFICHSCEKSESTPTEASFAIEISGENNPATLSIKPDKHSEEIFIKSNSSWKAEITQTESWLTISPVSGDGDGCVILSAEANETTQVRETIVTFYMNDKKMHSITVEQLGSSRKEKTLLLDVNFNNDGTATDASLMKHKVQTIEGSSLMTYYNEGYECYVARFNHTPGTSVGSGYYKIDYQNNQEFKNALANGHTLEVLFMYDSAPQIGKEVKMFSSMQAGGTGFLLEKDRGEITFLPNLSSGGWQWNRSGVVPERGKYYHAVGVWDRGAQKASVYVNGELKGSIDAKGDFIFPSPAICQWFGIGGDAAAGSAEAAWRGDIILSRIYDDPLSSEEVAELWEKVKDKQVQNTIEISDLIYFANFEVKEGSKYRIVGKGFKTGDKLKLESLSQAKEVFTCNATATDRYLDAEIPSGFLSGKYRLVLMRGGAQYPLGMAKLTLTEDPVGFVIPKVIAHRGFHTSDNKASENSVASFIAAQELGVYGSETDFYITKDNVVVCHHDPTIDGIKIEDAIFADICNKQLANGEKIPTLESYLEQLKKNSEMKLIIEIKSHSSDSSHDRIVKAVTEMVIENGVGSQVDYIAFSYYVCQKLNQVIPAGTIIGYLNGDKEPQGIEDGINCIDYSMDSLLKHPQWIKNAHEKGMTVNVWTVNSPQEMMDFVAMGVDFITTDYPDQLKNIISRFME